MLSGVRPEVRIEPDEAGRSQISRVLSRGPDRARRVAPRPAGLRAARTHRRSAGAAGWRSRSTSSRRIGAFNGGSVEHALRAAVQHQRQVGYVFSGSEPTLMERMLGKSRPFYKAGPVMRLQKIPGRSLRRLHRGPVQGHRLQARGRARRGDRRARRQPALRRAAPRARGLGRCEGGDEAVGGPRRPARDAEAAARRARRDLRGTWQRLTLAQRAALRAAVLEEGRELLSADVRARHRLSGTSTVQASLAALVREDILAREGTRYVGRRFALPGMGGAADVLGTPMLHGQRRVGPRDNTGLQHGTLSCEASARTSRPRTARAPRLGDVRLGELGVPDDHHRGRLPHLLPQRRRRGPRRQPWRPAGSRGPRPSPSSSSRWWRRCSAPSPTSPR